MRFISLLIISAISFMGCETISVSKIPPQYMFVRSYEAGQIQEAHTGGRPARTQRKARVMLEQAI